MVATPVRTDEETEALAGQFLTDDHWTTLIDFDADVTDPDGNRVLSFRKRAIGTDVCAQGYEALRDAAQATDNRGIAGGPLDETKLPPHVKRQIHAQAHSEHRFRYVKKDGKLSRTNYANTVHSGIIGFFDRNPRFPYCRQTAYTLENPERFTSSLPLLREIDKVYAECVPDKHAAQAAIVHKTHPSWVVHGTVFTTITVNRNWQTACHMDQGDLKEGFGCLTAFRSGIYTGGYLVFPKYGLAINMSSRDVLMANVGHEWHGNTAIKGRTGRYERLSLVMYYRTNMQACGSPAQELEMAKRRQTGDPVNRANPDEIINRATDNPTE